MLHPAWHMYNVCLYYILAEGPAFGELQRLSPDALSNSVTATAKNKTFTGYQV